MSKLDKIAVRIADVFFIEDWKWLTYRRVVQPKPFNPDAEQVEDYIKRLYDDGPDDPAWSHSKGRILLNWKPDGKVEVYLRMGTYKP